MEQQKQNITVVKGRTHLIIFPAITIDGVPYSVSANDRLVFTVKHSADSTEELIKKTMVNPDFITNTTDPNYMTKEYVHQMAHASNKYYRLESIDPDNTSPGAKFRWDEYGTTYSDTNYYAEILPFETAGMNPEHEYVYDVYLESVTIKRINNVDVTTSIKRYPIIVASAFKVLPSVG